MAKKRFHDRLEFRQLHTEVTLKAAVDDPIRMVSVCLDQRTRRFDELADFLWIKLGIEDDDKEDVLNNG